MEGEIHRKEGTITLRSEVQDWEVFDLRIMIQWTVGETGSI